MKNFFLVMMAVAVPILLGQMLLKVFFSPIKLFFMERMSMALGLGFGLVTMAMFYLSLAGCPLSTMNMMACTLLPMAFLYIIFVKKRVKAANIPNGLAKEQWIPVSMLLLFVAIAGTGFLFFRAVINTYDVWDNWAVWAFKAKIYFMEKGIPFEKFIQLRDVWGHWDYPHHLPLMEAWVCFWIGDWNDQWSRIIPPLFHLGICMVAYAYLRRHVNTISSLMGAFLVLTLPGLVRMTVGSLSEPVIIYYYLTSFFLLLEWDKSRLPSLLMLSAIFGALAAWTKNEGLAYGLFNVFIIFCMTRPRGFLKSCRDVALYAGIYAVILMPWWFIKIKLGLQNLLINGQNLTFGQWRQCIGDSLTKGFENFYSSVFVFGFFNVSWVMFFILLILNIRSLCKKPYNYILGTIVLNTALVLILTIIYPEEAMLEDALFRLLLFPTILAIIYSVSIQNEKVGFYIS